MENRDVRYNNLIYAIYRSGGVAQLASAVGCSEKYLRQIVQKFQGAKDKNPRKLGDKIAASIARWLNESPAWMDQPHPELWQEAGIKIGAITTMPSSTDVVIQQFNSEDVAGSMGEGLALRDQPGVIQSWRVNKQWLNENIRAHSGVANLCVVTGFGDSMVPLFNPGDPLLVDLGVKRVEFDAVYFFRIDGDGYVKRLQRIPTENGLIIRAISENKESYESFDITDKMDFEVLGRVLKVWRSQEF